MATTEETGPNKKNFLLIWIILVGAGMTIDIRLMSEVIGGSLFDGDEMEATTYGGIALGVGGVITLVLAWLADKTGRRWCLLISLVICSLGNLLGCAMPNYLTYVLIMIVSNTGLEGVCLFSFIMMMEDSLETRTSFLPSLTLRTLLVCWSSLPLVIGQAITPLVAVGFNSWRVFQAVISSIVLLTSVSWLGLKESRGWLDRRSPRATERATAVVGNTEQRATDNTSPPSSCSSTRSMRSITLIVIFCSITIKMLFWRLTMSRDKIKITENVFLNSVILPFTRLPFLLLLPFLLDLLGRRPVFPLTQMVPAILCVLLGFLTPGSVLFAVITFLAWGTAVVAEKTSYIYIAELFSGAVRARAILTCIYLGRVVTSLVSGLPFNDTDKVPEYVPLLVVGIAGVVGGLVALFLPETRGHRLPNRE